MEKYIVWYGLLIKSWVKRKSSWLQLVGMVLVILLVAGIQMPDVNNTVIGLCNRDGAFAKDVVKKLQDSESVFQFETYDDEIKLQEAVVSGKLESGFVFEQGLEKNLEHGKKKKLITFITTPLTTKGAVAKETVFAAFLERYSEAVLLEQEKTVFGKESEEISEALLERNQEYLGSDELFQIKFEEIGEDGKRAEEGAATFPVRGMVALLIFVIVLIEHGRKFEQRDCEVERALTSGEKRGFAFLRYVSAATIPALASILLLVGTGQGTAVAKEVLAMIVFVMVTGVWMVLVGKLFRSGTTYASWIMTLVLSNLLLCPVFINAAEYVPALGYLNCIFPVGIYLKLFL